MDQLLIPAFGETDYYDNMTNSSTRVVLLENAPVARFDQYCKLLKDRGFLQMEREVLPHRSFAAFRQGSTGVFLNYFAGTGQLQIVTEDACAYFQFSDQTRPLCATPQITQVYLSDYGLSYVIRLSDGRLIVIDGGNFYEQDVDNLFARLKKDSPYEKPVIAAWIISHPHSDHYFCIFPFFDKYGEEVVVEKFLYNMPQHDDLSHYPPLDKPTRASFAKWLGVDQLSTGDVLRMFPEKVAQSGIPVFTPHTGQRYQIGDAAVFFCSSIDDTIHCASDINATSLMFIMELAGQRIFFATDGWFSAARLADRYGSELKCDILQVPHHGFGGGTPEEQIRGFRLIAPRVCLLPVEKKLAYTTFCTFREGTQYLMTQQGVEEMISGEAERTLSLPYAPDPSGVYLLKQNYREGRDSAGARTWVFTDLHTDKPEDFYFNILNGGYINTKISVELFFENMQRKIIRRNISGPKLGVFRVNCLLNAEDAPDAEISAEFLESLGIPADTYFAVRFISSLPVVITHRDHAAAYHSSII